MHLLLAKSTFDHPHNDETVTPGQPLEVEDELATALLDSMLAEAPRPTFHHQVEEGPNDTSLHHKGGGNYLVLNSAGKVLNEDPLKGHDEAEAFAADID